MCNAFKWFRVALAADGAAGAVERQMYFYFLPTINGSS